MTTALKRLYFHYGVNSVVRLLSAELLINSSCALNPSSGTTTQSHWSLPDIS